MTPNTNKKKIIIIYPAAHLPDNVGSFRAMRMARALSREDREIILITADSREYINKTPWGCIISAKSKTFANLKNFVKKSDSFSMEFLRKAKSSLMEAIMQPDGNIPWNKTVLKEKKLIPYFKNSYCVVTTSPPHSVHLLGKALKKRYGCKWIMDMRDGWVDEPLAPKKFILKYINEALERKCLMSADDIIANTLIWKKYLTGRYPKLTRKIHTITNSLDENLYSDNNSSSLNPVKEKYLLYAGSFSYSDFKRKPEYLLEPLINNMEYGSEIKKILLIGRMSKYDLMIIDKFRRKAEKKDIAIQVMEQVPRHKIFKYIKEASGLLILSNSIAALPAKFFDYLPAERPILSFCFSNSSLSYYSSLVDSVYACRMDNYDITDNHIKSFIQESSKSQIQRVIPAIFTEKYFSEKLNKLIDL